MDKLYLQFILLLVASSLIGLLSLRVITGEIDAAMLYAITVISASGAGKWYARAAAEARSTAEGNSAAGEPNEG